ncbi:hypothetical protein [Acetivibrio mesophilus]|uniref:Uncharacterized protein n=1 Tax=Acetivibrio mesophilus TaxID=2487273 RepID=A0A4Q0I1Q9_9FIRM|nr:hypothetical protein [Acetivibrio mesophilus]ODM24763.1 hypothetical protein A7W90_00185 [Clostridium sp. Bc-iso-3]RXE58086.1 hypothetical protein EFD62_14205 [Acetivibrio mesophilus]
MDELMKQLSKYPNGTNIIIVWDTGLCIEGIINTIYESNNGLEEDEEGYKEFYACAVEVVSIIADSVGRVEVGNLIEVSMENCPLCVKLKDGLEIWKRP